MANRWGINIPFMGYNRKADPRAQQIQDDLTAYQDIHFENTTSGWSWKKEELLSDVKVVIGYITLEEDRDLSGMATDKLFKEGKLLPVRLIVGRSRDHPGFGVVGYSSNRPGLFGYIGKQFGFVKKGATKIGGKIFKSGRSKSELQKTNALYVFFRDDAADGEMAKRIMITAHQICQVYPDLGFCGAIAPPPGPPGPPGPPAPSPEGKVEFKATLDGKPWNGTFNINILMPSGVWHNGVSVTTGQVMDMEAGAYEVAHHSGEPPGAPFFNITPSHAQVLAPGKSLEFTFNFVSSGGGSPPPGPGAPSGGGNPNHPHKEDNCLVKLLIFLAVYIISVILMVVRSPAASIDTGQFIGLSVIFGLLISAACLASPSTFGKLGDKDAIKKWLPWIIGLIIAFLLLVGPLLFGGDNFYSLFFTADNAMIGNWVLILWTLVLIAYVANIWISLDDEVSIFVPVTVALIMTHLVDVINFGVSIGLFFIIFSIIAYLFMIFSWKFGLVVGAVGIIIILFMTSDWGLIVGQKASDVGTQVTTTVPVQGVWAKMSQIGGNFLLLLTNPQAWYENQYVKKGGERDEGATTLAVEVTQLEILPNAVDKGETISATAYIENKGQSDARNVVFKVSTGESVRTFGGGIPTKGGGLGEYYEEEVPHFIPGDGRYLSASIKAPICSGTFTAEASATYDYSVVGAANLIVMNSDEYQRLREQDKLTLKRELSVSSAGPFKITLQSDRNQPIPIAMGSADNVFKLFIGIVNERLGKAKIHPVYTEFYIPKELEPMEDECDDFRDDGIDPETGFRVLRFNLKYNDITDAILLDALGQSEYSPTSSPETLSWELADLPLVSGKRIGDINAGEVKVFTCKVRYAAEEDTNRFDIQKTLAIRANLTYQYTLSRKTTFNVKKLASEFVPTCEDLEVQGQQSYIDDIAYYCEDDGQDNIDKSVFQLISQPNKVVSTDSVVETKVCTLYARSVQGNQLSRPPINATKVICSANDNVCPDGWSAAIQSGDTGDDLQSYNDYITGPGEGQCHICYQRGLSYPLTGIRLVTPESKPASYTIVAQDSAFDLDGAPAGYLAIGRSSRILTLQNQNELSPESNTQSEHSPDGVELDTP